MQWRDAVLASLRSYSARHSTRVVERQQFISEELPAIIAGTVSRGLTPDQTLGRILQELRDEGLVQFLDRGYYLLLDAAIDVEFEGLTDEALDLALKANILKLGKVETDDRVCLARRRKGQDRLRRLVSEAYGTCCATCDITDEGLLIASHIVGWAEAPEHRGDLTNVICLCRIHDALFERGYWSLSDDLGLMKRPSPQSRLIRLLLDRMDVFHSPDIYRPSPQFLRVHRTRFGLAQE